MEQKKKLTLLWRKLNSLELGKDVVLVPYYLGQALGYQVEICCGYTEEVAEQISKNKRKGLRFNKMSLGHNPFLRIPVYIFFLLKNASRIDLLMCFHWKLETFINILFYRLLNKNGFVYIKLDTEFGKEWDFSKRSFFSRKIREILYPICLNKVTVLSCETSQSFRHLIYETKFGKLLKKKLILMPNAFDEAELEALDISERSYQQKENLMITVGRLGTHQKNTEMLLNALKKIDLKGWRFYLIGPIEKNIKPIIDKFYRDYPLKKEQIFFTGKIDDKKELWELYNKAKVFVYTSRWESYGLALLESKRLRNYIVSTRVGAAEDLLEQEKYGSFIEQEDSIGLANILSLIINEKINVDVYQNYDSHQLSYQKIIGRLLDFYAKS